MGLMSHKEIENMLNDLKNEVNYVIDKKLAEIRYKFELEMNELEEFYKKENLSDL